MSDIPIKRQTPAGRVRTEDARLFAKFADRIETTAEVTRAMVSPRENALRPGDRWFRYKEGFSASLVELFLDRLRLNGGRILDPFAGLGTALFAASDRGIGADGIELMPFAARMIANRRLLRGGLDEAEVNEIRRFLESEPWRAQTAAVLNEPGLARGAYPEPNRSKLTRFLASCERLPPGRPRAVVETALFSVLEAISFTHKDGQYVRWDDRSGRRAGHKKPFVKPHIAEFETALRAKIEQILVDSAVVLNDAVRLFEGSALDVLPGLEPGAYDAVITSPPYCNRYDYTRIYPLELALAGLDDAGLLALRQRLLSCTVESRAKDLAAMNPEWREPLGEVASIDLLRSVVDFLESEKSARRLNNNGVVRMVRGYFAEMACVLWECARVLRPEAPLVMVNDNVRFAGVSISVDLILAELAGRIGFRVEKILVLPDGKGNSSQQMGLHGREPLRKCVYVWRVESRR